MTECPLYHFEIAGSGCVWPAKPGNGPDLGERETDEESCFDFLFIYLFFNPGFNGDLGFRGSDHESSCHSALLSCRTLFIRQFDSRCFTNKPLPKQTVIREGKELIVIIKAHF